MSNARLATGAAAVLATLASSASSNHLPAVQEAGLDFCSAYVSRGCVVAERAAVQPVCSLAFGDSPFALDTWGSFVVQDRSIHSAVDEFDVTASAGREIPIGSQKFDVTTAWTYYSFTGAPLDSRHSEEVSLCCSQQSALGPSLTYYYDYGLLDASYLQIGIAPSFPIGKSGSHALDVSPSLGFGDLGQAYGFQDATLAVSTGFQWQGLDLAPVTGYTFGSTATNPDHHGVWAGLGVRIVSP